MNLLLSTAFFAPVHYYSRIIHHSKVYIEQFENFNKQTYRNRCVLLGGNGTVSLVVPVVRGRTNKILIRDLKIAYDTDWQRNQWRTLFSAYNSSPYFEYYQDDIRPYFQRKSKFLLDLNQQIHQSICEILEIENNTALTGDFENVPEPVLNYREVISPKVKSPIDKAFHPEPYTQVFSERFGFVPNLSILDLIFNEGPNAITLLEQSLRKN